MNTYRVNDIVAYTPFGGGTRHVRVTEKSADINKGRPGFAGVLVDERGQDAPVIGMETNTVWGYDSQISQTWDMSDDIH